MLNQNSLTEFGGLQGYRTQGQDPQEVSIMFKTSENVIGTSILKNICSTN